MPTKSPLRIETERLCRELPEANTRTLARRLAKEFSVTIEQARSVVRNVRGNCGEAKRKSLTGQVPRPNGVAGAKPQMPPSLADKWTPFVLEGVKRVGVISDVHIPYHSEVAFASAVADLKKRKIDCLLINGDFCDFYAISRWQKDPRKRDFSAELNACREALKWLRSQFPKARITVKAGNHEERYMHYLWNSAPEICNEPRMRLSEWLELGDIGAEYVEDQRPIMAGKLPIMHGHEKGKGISSPVNQARGAFMRLHHTVLEGHGHRTSGHCEPDMFGREVFCWSTGCLCGLNPEYARVANKWNWGFAAVDIAADGSFDVLNMRISEDGEVRKS